MKIGQFIPCYIDQFYPQVEIATYQLLEKLGCDIDFPMNRTCCGQPMANSGFSDLTTGCDTNFIKNFRGYDYILSPSDSCVRHIKIHLKDGSVQQNAKYSREHIYELTEFLVGILNVKNLFYRFSHRIKCSDR